MPAEKIFIIADHCFHCGEEIRTDEYQSDEMKFCCLGCRTVYDILSKHNLSNYYVYNNIPGQTQQKQKTNLDYLDIKEITSKLVDYQDENTSIITLFIPGIHCSSCIWLLEHLYQLQPAILKSRIDFLKKLVTITFKNQVATLKEIIEMLVSIGYEPLISQQDVVKEKQGDKAERKLITKIAVAGFCFGNVMLLSFPDYFGLSNLDEEFKNFFGWLNLAFSVPVNRPNLFIKEFGLYVDYLKKEIEGTLNITAKKAKYSSKFYDQLTSGIKYYKELIINSDLTTQLWNHDQLHKFEMINNKFFNSTQPIFTGL